MAEHRARELGVSLNTQSAGFLSFTYEANAFDLIISEFALHHLPDFWKAVALARLFNALKPGGKLFLRDIVFSDKPDGVE
ncbi:class I SAM-dependent methyltransferase, partial [Acinetobacter baumannii]|uniref:class I SAM-dependent methyltransferase n=1 Tax=Acinetobacter baumannii TaxID=470 RepID=UPI002091050F